MGKLLIRLLVAHAVMWPVAAGADVIVAPQVINTWPRQAATVLHQRMSVVDLGTLDEGEAVRVVVDVNNAVYKDVSVYVVDAPNMALARQNLHFRSVAGVTKKLAPFNFAVKIEALGPDYL